MLSEQAKDLIKNLVSTRIDEKSIDIKIELFEKLLELSKVCKCQENLGDLISAALNSFQTMKFNLKDVDYIEQILKVLLFISNEKKFDELNKTDLTLRPLYEYFNIIPPNDQLWFKISSKKIKDIDYIDTNHPLQMLKNNSKYPYICCYFLRNDISHDAKKEDVAFKMEMFINFLVAYLDIVGMYKNSILNKYFIIKYDLKSYIDNIIKKYENHLNYKYIPSKVTLFNEGYEGEEFKNKNMVDIVNLNKYKKIKIIGYAGAGKTSSLKYFVYCDALKCKKNNYTNNIPVYIEMALINKTYKNILDLIGEQLNIKDNEIINYLVQEKKIKLYIDGINEIKLFDNDKIYYFLQLLESFIFGANCNVIVSDRDSNEHSILNSEMTFILEPMSTDDIKDFVLGNSKKGEETYNKLMSEATNNEYLSTQIHKPFILKRIIDFIEEKDIIPKDSFELNSLYIESLIKRELSEKKDRNARYITKLLMYLAYYKPANSENIPGTLIYDVFENCMKRFNFVVDKEDMLILLTSMNLLMSTGIESYSFSEDFESYFLSLAVDAIDSGVEL